MITRENVFSRHLTTTTYLLSTACFMALSNPVYAQDGAEVNPDEVITVTASRSQKSAKAIPSTITLVSENDLENQLTISNDLFAAIGNLVPSLSPSIQKLTSSGESFRGRKPLYLIDGVPQSNPLRDGSRSSYTIDPYMISRVEVIHGSNAIQGLGATGGIINYVTREANDDGSLEQRAGFQITSDDDFHSNGFGYKGFYSVGQKVDKFDFYFAGSYHKRGISYDGNDNIVGIYSVQGDLQDSKQYDLYGKVGYEITETGKLSLMVNRFNLKASGNYVTVNGNKALGIPTSGMKGVEPGTPPINRALTSSLTYDDKDFAGGIFSASVYFQDFSALYGGSISATFQDPAIPPFGTLYEQSRNTSQKIGARTTYNLQNVANSGINMITGVDWLNDKTYQELYITKRNWVPETKFNNIAPFIQLDREIVSNVTLSGGARLEYARLSADDYETLAGNTRNDPINPYQIFTVEGGSQSFTEPLFNVGLVFDATDEITFFSSYSQGFTMPDVGRVLRAVSTPGVMVANLLDLEPVISDNLEFGVSYTDEIFDTKFSYFISKSDLGSRLSPNSDGIFSVNREKTRIKGFEVALSAQVNDYFKIGGNYSNIEGHYDSDGDNVIDTRLPSINISPDTINLYLQADLQNGLTARLQSSHYLDREFDITDSSTAGNFDGYTLVDFNLTYQSEVGKISLGIENLLDEYYITYNSQTYSFATDNRYFSGVGRTFTLGYMVDF
ncbi:MAG: TonB-dependent receptor [Alphaproteobacteria bacterium]|nr:TonB-dependent receptor [Alphaproteobacteria bacterium]HRW28986.1 TonB-dependent receptor [Emcibacteraceae bacterium]